MDADDVTRLRTALARISRQLARQNAADGVTRTQLSVLNTVGRSAPIGLGALADIEGLNPTLLSRVVGKLDAAGYLVRRTDPADRRAAVVELTPAGDRLIRRLRRARTATLAEHLDRLGADAATIGAALPALERLADDLAGVPAVTR